MQQSISSSWPALIVLVVLHLCCPASFLLELYNLWRNELKCSTVVQSCLRIKSSLCIATSPRFSSLIRLQFPSEVVSSLLLGFPNNDDIDWHQLTFMDMEIPWNSHNYHFKIIFFCFPSVLAQPGAFWGRCYQLRSFIWCWISWITRVSIPSKSKRTDGCEKTKEVGRGLDF
jgi:hypothetical protein